MSTAPVTFYRIRDFDRVFSCSQSKKMRDPSRAPWFACPIKWDGRGYMTLMEDPEGFSLFGAFIVIVQVSARCQRPGDLVSDGTPMTPVDVARKVRGDRKTIARAFEVLSSEPYKWIEQVDLATASNHQANRQSIGNLPAVDHQSTGVELHSPRQDRTGEGQGEGQGEEAHTHSPKVQDSVFPPEGIHSRLSAHIIAKSPRLAELTANVLSATVLLSDRFLRMPEDVLFAAADDFASAANAGEEFKTSIPKAFHTYVGNAYKQWDRDESFKARTSSAPGGAFQPGQKEPRGGLREAPDSAWNGLTTRTTADVDAPPSAAAARLLRARGPAALPLSEKSAS